MEQSLILVCFVVSTNCLFTQIIPMKLNICKNSGLFFGKITPGIKRHI